MDDLALFLQSFLIVTTLISLEPTFPFAGSSPVIESAENRLDDGPFGSKSSSTDAR